MKNKTIIREAKKQDLKEMLELYEELYKNFYSDDKSISKESDVKELWEKVYENSQLKYFVVDKDDKIVSTCTLTIIPNLSYKGRPYGLIEHVVTRKEYQGQGLGTKLLKHTLNFAWQENCYKVMLMTSENKESIIRFYEKAGFRQGVKTAFVAYSPDR